MVSSQGKRKNGGRPANAKAANAKVKTVRHKHRLAGALSGVLTVAVLAEIVMRLLPADLQALPYVPLVLFFSGYYLGFRLGGFGALVGGLGFVLGILLVLVYDRKVARKANIDYTITAFARKI